MLRRHSLLSLVSLLLVFVLIPAGGLSAQATPAPAETSSLSAIGLPELNITVTDSGLDGLPDELEANRYLINVESTTDAAGGVEFVQPPPGVTTDDFINALAELHGAHDHDKTETDDHEDAGVTDHESTEAAHDNPSSPPAAIYEATFVGGIVVDPGQTAQVVVDLVAGQWLVTGGPDSQQEPVKLVVTGDMPTDLPEPESSSTLTMGEYIILVSDGELVNGPQVLRIDNIGAQPHFISFNRTTANVTNEEALAAMRSGEVSTPASADAFDPTDDLEEVFTTGTQSSGTTIWVSMDLEPGRYVLFCHFPDVEDGLGHEAHGMVIVIDVPDS